MNFYFSLQLKRIWRLINEAGIHPIIGLAIVLIAFLGFSHLLFLHLQYAEYIYLLMAISFIYGLRNKRWIEFLSLSFSRRELFLLVLIENIALSSPFIFYLLLKAAYIPAFILFSLISIQAFSLYKNKKMAIFQFNFFSKVIPTPFYKFPFEFIIGFRKTYLFLISIYVLTGISIYHSNFNLGVFSLILPSLLVSFSFYTSNESRFFVWVHSCSPSQFLFLKMKIGVIYGLLMTLPLGFTLFLFNIDQWGIIVLAEFLGVLFILTSIAGKYAYYPCEINIIQGFAIGFSMIFPPFLLVLIPFLFIKAKENLSPLLR